jgi:hypothetical protein
MLRPAVFLTFLALSPLAFAQDGVGSQLERTDTSTPQEKLEYATSANNEMRDAVKLVSKMLESARRESDVEGLQCLTNRLTSIRALLQVSESAELTMKDALGTGQGEKADHEYRKMAVALNKSRQLMAEAERCASSDNNLTSGDSVIRVEGGLGGSSEDDTAALVFDDFDTGMDPEEVSPF